MNGTTAQTTVRREGRVATAWDLSALVRPLPQVTERRPPRRQQARLLPHYPAIVDFVWRNRFAIRPQIQRRFARWLSSDRTARYQLARLVELGYLATAPVASTSPNFPLVYLATAKGARLVQRAWAERGVEVQATAAEEKRERGRALLSITHELYCTEFTLACHEAVRERDDLELFGLERRYFRRDRALLFGYRGERRRLVPDAGFMLALKQPAGGRGLLLHFLEMDNGTESLPKILEKWRLYAAWARSEERREHLVAAYKRQGAASPAPQFRLVVVAHDKRKDGGDERRLLDLFTQALDEEVWPALRDRLWLTTVEQLEQAGRRPLAAPVWLRLRDAKEWVHAYRTHMTQGPRGPGQKPFHHQRSFVAERLAELPRHRLFPEPTTRQPSRPAALGSFELGKIVQK